jgi:hypothetical protein
VNPDIRPSLALQRHDRGTAGFSDNSEPYAEFNADATALGSQTCAE